jgi:hypothetical protein
MPGASRKWRRRRSSINGETCVRVFSLYSDPSSVQKFTCMLGHTADRQAATMPFSIDANSSTILLCGGYRDHVPTYVSWDTDRSDPSIYIYYMQ